MFGTVQRKMNVIDLTGSSEQVPSPPRQNYFPPPPPSSDEPIGVNVCVDVLDLTEEHDDAKLSTSSIPQHHVDWNDIAEQRAARVAFQALRFAPTTISEQTSMTTVQKRRKGPKGTGGKQYPKKREKRTSSQPPGEHSFPRNKKRSKTHHHYASGQGESNKRDHASRDSTRKREHPSKDSARKRPPRQHDRHVKNVMNPKEATPRNEGRRHNNTHDETAMSSKTERNRRKRQRYRKNLAARQLAERNARENNQKDSSLMQQKDPSNGKKKRVKQTRAETDQSRKRLKSTLTPQVSSDVKETPAVLPFHSSDTRLKNQECSKVTEQRKCDAKPLLDSPVHEDNGNAVPLTKDGNANDNVVASRVATDARKQIEQQSEKSEVHAAKASSTRMASNNVPKGGTEIVNGDTRYQRAVATKPQKPTVKQSDKSIPPSATNAKAPEETQHGGEGNVQDTRERHTFNHVSLKEMRAFWDNDTNDGDDTNVVIDSVSKQSGRGENETKSEGCRQENVAKGAEAFTYTPARPSPQVIDVDEPETARSLPIRGPTLSEKDSQPLSHTENHTASLTQNRTCPAPPRATTSLPQKSNASSVKFADSGPTLKELINTDASTLEGKHTNEKPCAKAKTTFAAPQDERKSWQSTVIIVDSSDDEQDSSIHDTNKKSGPKQGPEVEFVKKHTAPKRKLGRPPSSFKRYKPKRSPIEQHLRKTGQYNFHWSEEEAQREQERLFQEAADRLRRQQQAATTNTVVGRVVSDVKELCHDHWKSSDMYVRLGLAPGAPIHEVKRRYRRLALAYHPDKGSTYVHTTARFQAVTEAYKIICGESERIS